MEENISLHYVVHEGEIEGAKYKIVVPDQKQQQPKRKVMIWCHGYRPEGIPLHATLTPEAKFNQYLMREGWILSATSYRREGYILQDAITDINNLREYIISNLLDGNPPSHVILYGESMGGPIMVLTVECYPHLYSGVLAIGAALWIKKDPPDNPIQFKYNPQVPILFLTNNTELGPPQEYIAKCKTSGATVIPVLWTLKRGGHCVFNLAEEKVAWVGLMEWLDSGTIEADKDATIDEQEHEEHVTKVTFDAEKKGAWGKVIDVNMYREVVLNFHHDDFNKLFIFQNSKFKMEVGFERGKTIEVDVLFGGYPFAGVEFGSWTAGIILGGWVKVRIHDTGTTKNEAADLLGVNIGDIVFVHEKRLIPQPKSNAMMERIVALQKLKK